MAKRHGFEFWRAHLEAWHQSDLTQTAYCTKHELSERAFSSWRRKAKGVVAVTGVRPSLTLVAAQIGVLAPGGVVRLHSPGGWRIELPTENTSWLTDLLRQLP